MRVDCVKILCYILFFFFFFAYNHWLTRVRHMAALIRFSFKLSTNDSLKSSKQGGSETISS